MLSTVMMALGAFRFGVLGDSYQELTRKAAFRWEKQDRIGRAPALQYLGPDAEDITLKGIIYPHYRGGLRQVELMRAIAGTGTPMMMVDGLGWVWQRWCLIEVTEVKSVLFGDGTPRKIEFSVTLRAYGEDAA